MLISISSKRLYTPEIAPGCARKQIFTSKYTLLYNSAELTQKANEHQVQLTVASATPFISYVFRFIFDKSNTKNAQRTQSVGGTSIGQSD